MNELDQKVVLRRIGHEGDRRNAAKLKSGESGERGGVRRGGISSCVEKLHDNGQDFSVLDYTTLRTDRTKDTW